MNDELRFWLCLIVTKPKRRRDHSAARRQTDQTKEDMSFSQIDAHFRADCISSSSATVGGMMSLTY